MSVNNTVDIFSMPINVKVGEGIRGGFKVALVDMSIQIKDNHFFWREVRVKNSTGFYDHQSGLRVPRTNITASPRDQIIF